MTKPSETFSQASKISLFEDTIQLAEPIVQEICAISGTPGLAIGMFDRAGKIGDRHLGYGDTTTKLRPDADTVFNLGSMCTGFTALAVACLVSDGMMRWDDRIDKFIGALRGTHNGAFSIRDLLSHRTGLCRSDALFIGSDNELLLTKSQDLDLFASLAVSRPPRQEFIYNNFGYHAVGCAIEQVSSMNYGDFLADRIFKPLDMNRTYTTLPPATDDNISAAYRPYHNLELRQVPPPRISNDTVAFAAGCMRSCIRDLVVFYSALLRNFNALMPESVWQQLRVTSGDVRALFEATVPLHTPTSIREQSYAMGWARTQLPNQMSELSGNSGLLDTYPVTGDMAHGLLVFHHGGNNLGCSSTVYIFPELEMGIVVLGNALGHCDAADWAAQVLAEAYICSAVKTDFARYVLDAASRGRGAMERVQAQLDEEKRYIGPTGDLGRYVGRYWHSTAHFFIAVALSAHGEGKDLTMAFQGRDNEMYTLRYYHQDTFVFNETFDELVNRGQWCRPYWFYMIEFVPTEEMSVFALRWRLDDTKEEGQIFKRSLD